MATETKDKASIPTYIALGANLDGPDGSPARTVRLAIAALREMGQGPVHASAPHSSPAFPPGSGPDYVNAVVRVDSPPGRTGADVLDGLHAIEARMGRHRGVRWGARVVDLDLLAHGSLICPDVAGWAAWAHLPPDRQRVLAPDGLVLPHPRLQDRAFVLRPWAQIAPGWTHPVTGLTVAAMLEALPRDEVDAVIPLPPDG